MLDFVPLGGSLVILIEACTTAAGRSSDGYEVSHNRNEVFIFPAGMSSTIRSKRGIQDGAR